MDDNEVVHGRFYQIIQLVHVKGKPKPAPNFGRV